MLFKSFLFFIFRHSTTIHSNLIKKKNNLILFYINGEDIIKMTFNIYIYIYIP